jgi:large subunit ribosomal protein L18
MFTKHDRSTARGRRHRRVRKRVKGTEARPRLTVHRSLRHVSAQVIDDTRGHTLAAASSYEVALRPDGAGNLSEAAEVVGKAVGERARKAGVATVVFDRGGFMYHGRVKVLADAARAAGLEF